jgi:hypothetical protein
MSRHKTLVVNAQYPRFSGSPALTTRRADAIAGLFTEHGCDTAVFGEAGYNECLRLSGQPGLRGIEYDRAQGRGRGIIGEGLNSVWSDPDVWRRASVSDYSLPSFGQWQRTALGVRLEEVADPTAFATVFAVHFAAKGAPLTAAGADRAKLAQVKYLASKTGERRTMWLGDFPRTGASDDLRWLDGQGYRNPGRTSTTPLTVLVQGAITVHAVTRHAHGSMFDHDYLVADWSVTGKKVQP